MQVLQTLVDCGHKPEQYPHMANDLSATDLRAIGQRIIDLRTALEMTQADLARHLGFSTQALANYETGIRRPNLDQAFIIVRRTGVTLDWIYFGDRSGLPMRIASKLPDETDQRRETAA